MTEQAPPPLSAADSAPLSAADAAFLERCREDLDELFAPHDLVVAVMPRPRAGDESVELEARVMVSGRQATFAASGETIVDAYAHLRAAAPEQRAVLAFRALVEPHAAR